MDANKENYIVINGITYKPIIVENVNNEYGCSGCDLENNALCMAICNLFEENAQSIIMKKLKIEG